MSNTKSQTTANVQQAQKQVDDVIVTMKDNLVKVINRGDNLTELDNKARHLEEGSHQFQLQTKKLKNKYWWEDMKMKLIMAGIGASFILLIIIIVCVQNNNNN